MAEEEAGTEAAVPAPLLLLPPSPWRLGGHRARRPRRTGPLPGRPLSGAGGGRRRGRRRRLRRPRIRRDCPPIRRPRRRGRGRAPEGGREGPGPSPPRDEEEEEEEEEEDRTVPAGILAFSCPPPPDPGGREAASRGAFGWGLPGGEAQAPHGSLEGKGDAGGLFRGPRR